jgi:hypothetical protein
LAARNLFSFYIYTYTILTYLCANVVPVASSEKDRSTEGSRRVEKKRKLPSIIIDIDNKIIFRGDVMIQGMEQQSARMLFLFLDFLKLEASSHPYI